MASLPLDAAHPAAGWTPLGVRIPVQLQTVWTLSTSRSPSGWSSATTSRARPPSGTDALGSPSRTHGALGSSGSARRTQRARSTTGTRTPVSVVWTSLLFLQVEGWRRCEASPHLGCHSFGNPDIVLRALERQLWLGVCVLPVEFCCLV